jgi:hypothetical protein
MFMWFYRNWHVSVVKLASKQMQLYFAWRICVEDVANNKDILGNETLYHKQILVCLVLCKIDIEYCLQCFLWSCLDLKMQYSGISICFFGENRFEYQGVRSGILRNEHKTRRYECSCVFYLCRSGLKIRHFMFLIGVSAVKIKWFCLTLPGTSFCPSLTFVWDKGVKSPATTVLLARF